MARARLPYPKSIRQMPMALVPCDQCPEAGAERPKVLPNRAKSGRTPGNSLGFWQSGGTRQRMENRQLHLRGRGQSR